MKKARLPVEVTPGMFRSELAVSFDAGGQRYSLIVDREDVEGNMLVVRLVQQEDGEAVIDLPRDTFTSGNRIRVPAALLAVM